MALSRASLITQQKFTKNAHTRWARGKGSDGEMAQAMHDLAVEYLFAADWLVESKALQGKYTALARINAEQAARLCPKGMRLGR